MRQSRQEGEARHQRAEQTCRWTAILITESLGDSSTQLRVGDKAQVANPELTAVTARSTLLGLAAHRLNRSGAPALHNAAPKARWNAEDRIHVDSVGATTTTPPGGIAGTDAQRVHSLQDCVAEHITWKFSNTTDSLLGTVALPKEVECRRREWFDGAQTENKFSHKPEEECLADSSASRADQIKETAGLHDLTATLFSRIQRSNRHSPLLQPRRWFSLCSTIPCHSSQASLVMKPPEST